MIHSPAGVELLPINKDPHNRQGWFVVLIFTQHYQGTMEKRILVDTAAKVRCNGKAVPG